MKIFGKSISSQNTLRITFLATVLAFFVMGAAILISLTRNNNLPLNDANRVRITKLIPQGWSFFTRDPEEEDLYVYKYDSTKHTVVCLNRTLNAASNFLGLKRICPNAGVELAFINSRILKREWVKCKRLKNFNIGKLEPILIVNTVPEPSMDGLYVLQKKVPVPFLWSKSFKSEMPSEIVLVNIVNKNNGKKDR